MNYRSTEEEWSRGTEKKKKEEEKKKEEKEK